MKIKKKTNQCATENKCISNEFVCNGYQDWPDGDDEANCFSTCDSPRYLKATNQPNLLQSKNYPDAWLGNNKWKLGFPRIF